MGQLRTRKRGSTWQYSFEAAPVNGKRKSISKGGFRTKAEALTAGTAAMNEYNSSGQSFTPSELSVSDYLDYWFDNYCKMNLKYNTQLGYLYIVENRLKPRFRAVPAKITEHCCYTGICKSVKNRGACKIIRPGNLAGIIGCL